MKKTCIKCNRDITSQGYKQHFNTCDGSGILKRERPKKGKSWKNDYWKGKKLSQEHKNKIKESFRIKKINGIESNIVKWMKDNPELHKKVSSIGGGIKEGTGIGKKGRYLGYWCDSSWELAYVIYCLDNNIEIKRNTKAFNYNFNNKINKYYPDFIVEGNYVEIKGYETERDKEKIKQFPLKIKVLYKKDLEHILTYVKSKYGKNFTLLYE